MEDQEGEGLNIQVDLAVGRFRFVLSLFILLTLWAVFSSVERSRFVDAASQIGLGVLCSVFVFAQFKFLLTANC